MDTGRRTGLQGVVDEDGREVDVCCGVGTSLWEDWDAVQMGGKVGNERQVESASRCESDIPADVGRKSRAVNRCTGLLRKQGS